MHIDDEGMIFFAKLLALLERGSLGLTVETWRQHLQENSYCDDGCPYESIAQNNKCAICLEGKLRTLSLRTHSDDYRDCPYRNGANKVSELLEKEKGKSEMGIISMAPFGKLGVRT